MSIGPHVDAGIQVFSPAKRSRERHESANGHRREKQEHLPFRAIPSKVFQCISRRAAASCTSSKRSNEGSCATELFGEFVGFKRHLTSGVLAGFRTFSLRFERKASYALTIMITKMFFVNNYGF